MMAERIAQAATAFEEVRGRAPASVTAVLSQDTPVITLHGIIRCQE